MTGNFLQFHLVTVHWVTTFKTCKLNLVSLFSAHNHLLNSLNWMQAAALPLSVLKVGFLLELFLQTNLEGVFLLGLLKSLSYRLLLVWTKTLERAV